MVHSCYQEDLLKLYIIFHHNDVGTAIFSDLKAEIRRVGSIDSCRQASACDICVCVTTREMSGQ